MFVPLKTPFEAIEMIKRYEGLRLGAYRCPARKLTIGYGHTGRVWEGMQITPEQADAFLREDLRNLEPKLDELLPARSVNPNQYGALSSFVYNLGPRRFRMSQLRRRIILGEFEQASWEFRRWVYANSKKLDGLVKRRAEEAALFMRPYPGPERLP